MNFQKTIDDLTRQAISELEKAPFFSRTDEDRLKAVGNIYFMYSPLLYFSYNEGECVLNDGFKGLFFVESNHLVSFSAGRNDAGFVVIDEMEGVDLKCGLNDFKTLLSFFKKDVLEFFASIDVDAVNVELYGENVRDLLDEYEIEFDDLVFNLLTKFRNGESVFKEAVFEEFFQKP